MRSYLVLCCLIAALSTASRASGPRASFEIATRMEIDVDGAPNAYGPPGKKTLDNLINAHDRERPDKPIVGYLLEDDNPKRPVIQGLHDPCPGFYVSTTAVSDRSVADERNPRKYLDATAINYIVLGTRARRQGARLGDLVAVHSKLHRRSVYGIVGDAGNPSGEEGSLHLLQDLGYPFRDGKTGSVEGKDIVVRFFPHSNPHHQFFHTQAELDRAAEALHLSRTFPTAKHVSGPI